jgi:C-methyltransferase C-terminal domain/Putative zinc binding domain/Methyltransferase domain
MVTTLPIGTERTISTSLPLCRFCDAPLSRTFVDLGMSPPCESFLAAEELNRMEPFYPLHVRTCEQCFLVQLEEYVAPTEIFTEYAYFSSFSDSWVTHARAYAEKMTGDLGLGPDSLVVELASNDGYLLQHFVAAGIPVVGVEPARNVAEAAIAKGIPTRVEFFGREAATRMRSEGMRPDLIAANNVLAQVPDLNDFVGGVAILLRDGGRVTLEFPHLANLIELRQFDTIYHEHFSYFSFLTTRRILAAHGMEVVDVEEIPTHGGSLRVHAEPVAQGAAPAGRVEKLAAWETAEGYGDIARYASFAPQVEEVKRRLLTYLIEARDAGRHVVGYGAPGKGNTLLNYCGIRSDLLEYTVDRNPYKHGRFLPGTHIPIHPPERIAETRPDDILILPWNLEAEIVEQLAYTRDWGARLVIPIPTVKVI